MLLDDNELVPHLKRQDNKTKNERQAAASILQQYSLLALLSLKEDQSPAKTRLDMMRILTDLPPALPKDVYSGSFRKRSSGFGGSSGN